MAENYSKHLFPFKSGENFYIFIPNNVSIYQVPSLYYEIAGLWPDEKTDAAVDTGITDVAGITRRIIDMMPQYAASEIGPAIKKLQTLLDTANTSRKENDSHFPGLKEIHLQVSYICNLNCKYCYAGGGNYGGPALKMDEKTARQAVDYFIQSIPEGTVGDLSFDGGEPLTNWEMIRYVVDYGEKKARELDRRLFFFIGTNGTLLNKRTYALIKNKHMGVGVSIDGDAAAQDANRKFRNHKGSYNTLALNIKNFIAYAGNQNLQARSTITRQNLKVPDTVKHLLNMGFNHIYLDPVSSTDSRWQLNAQELEIIKKEFTLLADFYTNALLNGKVFIIRNFYLFIKRIHFKKKLFYKCGAGRNGVAITPKGDIYPCYRFTSVPGYCLGNIFAHGIDKEFQRQFINNHVDERLKCRECWARYLCGGGCPYHSVYKQGSIFKNDDQECGFLLHLAALSLQIYMRVKNNNPRFWDSFFQAVGRH